MLGLHRPPSGQGRFDLARSANRSHDTDTGVFSLNDARVRMGSMLYVAAVNVRSNHGYITFVIYFPAS